jgi:Protein of unknown function (DUF2591)
MKIRTSELGGPTLDWAVAKCEESSTHYQDYRVADGYLYAKFCDMWLTYPYCPSTNWSQGGPIIEHEKITFDVSTGGYVAYIDDWPCEKRHSEFGETHLIAATRCYVVSRLGDEVEVPNELCQA